MKAVSPDARRRWPDPGAWLRVAPFIALLGGAAAASAPFAGDGPVLWEEMNGRLLAVTAALAAASVCGTLILYSARHALLYASLVFAVSWAAEWAGTRWGFPFGRRYAYHAALTPALPGSVPLFIPLAWLVLAGAPTVVLRGMRVTSGPGSRVSAGRVVLKSALCAVFLAAADVALDPLAVSVNAWTWEWPGMFFGVPFASFAGWFAVGFVVYTAYFGAAGAARPRSDGTLMLFDTVCLAAGAVFFGMAALAAWRRLGSLVPLAVSGAVMLPYGIGWLAATWRAVRRGDFVNQ